MSPDDARVRAWLRAPADPFVEQFADDGAFGGLTQWVRAASPALDLHLWSDRSAAMHRARVVAGTVGLIDLIWSPHRFRIAARRPFTRSASGWLDDAWHPERAAPERIRRAVGFGEIARELAASRAEFGIAALSRLDVITQEYTPLLAAPLETTPLIADIRQALIPSPIAGGEPFFAAAPDAVSIGVDGVVEFVRVYSARAPELRFAAAQAVADVGLYAALDPISRQQQVQHFTRLASARRRLGLPTTPRAAVDAPARARILASADLSPRLRDQFRSVRARLVDHGLLPEDTLQVEVVDGSAASSGGLRLPVRSA